MKLDEPPRRSFYAIVVTCPLCGRIGHADSIRGAVQTKTQHHLNEHTRSRS